jgi:hypothetical protein
VVSSAIFRLAQGALVRGNGDGIAVHERVNVGQNRPDEILIFAVNRLFQVQNKTVPIDFT